MEIQRSNIWKLVSIVVAILLVFGYWLLFSGYQVEERSISRFAEQEASSRFGIEQPHVLSVERFNDGRASAFIFRVADAAGREYHLAGAFRRSLVSQRYRLQDLFLIENDIVSEERGGILKLEDYLRSFRFDVRGNQLQLLAAVNRLSPGTLGVAAMSIIFCAAFLFVFNRGDQAGMLEAVAAETSAEYEEALEWLP